MNENTKESLIKFVEAVESLTVGVSRVIEVDLSLKIMDACYNLRESIRKDETLQFPR